MECYKIMTSIKDFQELMEKIYIQRDSKRGEKNTMLWLMTEVGEFANALIKGNKKDLEDEAADVLAWLCSECNLLGIDLEKVAVMKYNRKCPKCKSMPCVCNNIL
jgi:NTP pyrophosphatase (non-canonical NTP hydrolase)